MAVVFFKPCFDGFEIGVIWAISLDPCTFVFVYRTWPNLVAVFAKWDDIEIARFVCSVSIADDVMCI